MKGLILKDIISLKDQGKMIVLLFIFYTILSMTSGNNSMFSMIIVLFCIMLPITAMSYDEKAKWEKYALSMPISRVDLVLSKYILALILCGIGFIINTVYNLLAASEAIRGIITSSYIVTGMSLALVSFLLPILFKFGVEKGRFLMMLIFFIPAGGAMLLPRLGIELPNEETLKQMLTLSPYLVAIIYLLSIMVSLQIYSKKEM